MAVTGPTEEQKELINPIETNDINQVKTFFTSHVISLDFTYNIGFLERTPLCRAVNLGNKQIVELLIEKGADINFQNTGGWTPLHVAVYFNQPEIVQLLIDKGADILIKDNSSDTPISLAKKMNGNDNDKIIDMLERAEKRSTVASGVAGFADSLSASVSRLSASVDTEDFVSMREVDDKKEDVDDKPEQLFSVQPGVFTPSLTVKTSPKPSDRSFSQQLLSDAQMRSYKELFPDVEDHYAKLAKIIKHQNEAASSSLEGKTANFQRRLKNIIPAVQFAVQGAREQYRKDPSNKDLKARMEAFEAIQDMLISLKSLTKNKSRYTKEQLEKRLGEINAALKSAGCSDASAKVVEEALRDVAENNTFKKRKFYQSDSLGMGSTPFDTSEPSMKVGDIRKRVKIEYSNNGKEVSAIFSYSRNKLLGQFSKKIWTTRAGEFKNFQSQIRSLVNGAIIEFSKGSKTNPIDISYIGPPQPEAAIMLLMEFKKRAILEGKTFYAIHNGKLIEITSLETFGADEKDYFMKYALEHPQFAKESDLVATKGCAGYKVFKQGGVEMNKTKDEDRGTDKEKTEVGEAMQKFLDRMVEKSRAKLNRKMDVVANELCEVNKLNSWKDGTARKPPMFRA